MPFSLNGAPGDAALFPGRVLAEKAWQLWLGCPEPPALWGLSAKAGAAHAKLKLAARSAARVSFLMFRASLVGRALPRVLRMTERKRLGPVAKPDDAVAALDRYREVQVPEQPDLSTPISTVAENAGNMWRGPMFFGGGSRS
jgi:hypothetical protein